MSLSESGHNQVNYKAAKKNISKINSVMFVITLLEKRIMSKHLFMQSFESNMHEQNVSNNMLPQFKGVVGTYKIAKK